MLATPNDRLQVTNTRKLIAVASGKGGVGKSTIAVNLSVALAQQGYRVGLLDADVHGPNVPLMLGVRRRASTSGWQAMLPVASNQTFQHQTRLPALERYGVKVMSIGLLVGEDQAALVANVETVGFMVRNLLTMVDWGELDVLFMDFPPGISEPQATLLKTVSLDGALIVLTPQDLARLDSSRALKAFQDEAVPILGVVENMSYLICPHCGEHIDIFHRGTVNRPIDRNIPTLAQIPLDQTVSAAGDTGRPVLITMPESPQAQALSALARKVAERLEL